jgi:hypothetical protein
MGPGVSRGFAVFAGVFEGGFGKSGVQRVVLRGENVVEYVVNVVGKTIIFAGQKIGQGFEVYFC